ncbi:MAG: hypothetical protein R6U96_04895 [Promethearchaeia archaeon]
MAGAINDGQSFENYSNNTITMESHIDTYQPIEEICFKKDSLETHNMVEALLKDESD